MKTFTKIFREQIKFNLQQKNTNKNLRQKQANRVEKETNVYKIKIQELKKKTFNDNSCTKLAC